METLGASATQLFVGGLFTTVGGVAHAGIASVSPTTGVVNSYVNIQLAGHHNYTGVAGQANAGVGASQLAVRPDGKQMVIIGNFKTASKMDRDQIVMLTLGTTSATITNWETNVLKDKCNPTAFDSWIRGVDYSPGGSYFVIDGTGGPFPGQHCDSVMQFSDYSTGTALAPTWIDYSGGDTFLSVAVSGAAIYVGGHFRWLNNTYGSDSSSAGAVGRPGLAALDPTTGLPRTWNPGRNPRGYGAPALYVDPADPAIPGSGGLYVGSDTDYIGPNQYLRGKIAFFPLDGGDTPEVGKTAAVPGNLYTDGAPVAVPATLARINVGGKTVAATDGGPDWLGDTQTATPNRVANGTVTTFASNPTHGAGASLPSYAPLALFNSQRSYTANTPTAWTFSVPAATVVNVNLFVAQRSFDSGSNAPTSTSFSVIVNGQTVITNFDPNATIGYQTAGELPSIPVTVPASGVVTVGFSNTAGAAAVDAIELTRTGGTATTSGFYKRAFSGTALSTTTYTLLETDNTPWKTNARGAFAVDNKVFYGLSDGNFYVRSFDGTTLGTPSFVNPYTDPVWDTFPTGSGSTVYLGVKSSFYGEIPLIRSMFFLNGKLYYTRSDSSNLYWRWFTPESGVVGTSRNTVGGTAAFGSASGVLMISGTKLYFSKSDGKLYSLAWNGSSASGTAKFVTGTHGLALTAAFLGP